MGGDFKRRVIYEDSSLMYGTRSCDGGSWLLSPFWLYPHVDTVSFPSKDAALSGHQMPCPDLGLLLLLCFLNKSTSLGNSLKAAQINQGKWCPRIVCGGGVWITLGHLSFIMAQFTVEMSAAPSMFQF